MIKLPYKKIPNEQLCTVLLWVLAIVYFYFISIHSAKPAEVSTNESKELAKKTFAVVQKTVEAVSKDKGAEVSYILIFVFVRKLAHLINFFILSFLYSMTAYRTGNDLIKVFTAAMVCGLFGSIIDEGHQFFVPGRSSEIKDVIIDFLGVCIGCITFLSVFLLLNKRMLRKE
ncbi:MAG: hypothetical protein E7401_03750 [Ruminococcaceae bacterium]|nr:hypothetical protein [Oscillospiraceae bacterium]